MPGPRMRMTRGRGNHNPVTALLDVSNMTAPAGNAQKVVSETTAKSVNLVDCEVDSEFEASACIKLLNKGGQTRTHVSPARAASEQI